MMSYELYCQWFVSDVIVIGCGSCVVCGTIGVIFCEMAYVCDFSVNWHKDILFAERPPGLYYIHPL